VASDAFIKALELVMLGETILPSELLSYVAYPIEDPRDVRRVEAPPDNALRSDPSELPRLSSREEYILRSIVEGHPNKIIARKMGIAEGTVKVHVKAILRKVRVQNRTQAAIWAMNNKSFGLLEARTRNGVMHFSATEAINASMRLLVEHQTNHAERKFD
jgi:two-component system nitrate/nitrite response regulator NarL